MLKTLICSSSARGSNRCMTKILLVMKLTMILLTVGVLTVTAKGVSQNVTYTGKNVSLQTLFNEVKKQTGYFFLFPSNTLSDTKNLSVSVHDMPLIQFLGIIFKDQPLKYSIESKTINVSKKSDNGAAELMLATEIRERYKFENPELIISGRVLDNIGNPLSNVSILNLRSQKGVASKKDGTFNLEASIGDTVQFSYVGFAIRKVKITGATPIITVRMELLQKDVEEFVVTGYQQIKKSQMTGAVSHVKAEDLLINGTSTIEQALQGKLSGVEITSSSGQIGTRQSVRVRGVSTLLGNQEPVWVVDGIIQEDPLPFKAKELNAFNGEPSNSSLLRNFIGSTIAWLNPYDIEDVTVLKDAASTAIYGVKAANGVILINTKRGKEGRAPSITYSSSISTQTKPSYDKLNLMNSKERVDVSREIWQRGLIGLSTFDDVGYTRLLKQYLEQKITYADFNTEVKKLEVNNTDWFDVLFQNPINQSHNLSLSGGGGNSSYYGSFGTNMQRGQAKGNGQKSYQGSINFTSNISSKLSVSAKLAGSYSKTDGFYRVDPYSYATKTSRVIPAYNDDESFHYYNYFNSGYRYNVINELNESGNTNTNTSLNSNLSVRYKILNGLNFESLLGINYSNISSEAYATERTHSITSTRGYEYGLYGPSDQLYKMSRLPFGGILTTISNNNYNYTWRNGINYGRTYNKKHAVTGLLGVESRSNIYKATNATIYGYMPDRGKVILTPPPMIENSIGTPGANLLYSADLANTVITDRTSNYMSYYSSGSYTYDNRYVFNVSIRGDASNRFGQDERVRFKPIWALGGRWNIANEKFFQKSNWLNDLSIRASYGFQGNVAENYGPDLIIKIPSGSSSISALTGEPIYRISTLPYTNLRWEKTQTVNLGIDFNFFKGRISASFDYYNKRSKDLIALKAVPYENGILQMPVNSGTLYNSGYDISVNFTPVKTKNFSWNIGITTSKNFNKITSRQVQNPIWNVARSGSYHKEGYAVSSFWVFDYIGPDSATGIPLFNIPTTAVDPNAKFDATAFMKYAGKMNPDLTSGLSTNIRYKTFSIGTSMYLSVGGKKLLAPLYTLDMISSTPYEYNNLSKDLVNRWRKPGDNKFTDIPSIPQSTSTFITIPSGSGTFGDHSQGASERPYTLYNFSTARVVDASYLRINNININYSLPTTFTKRIFSKSVNIGYSISNLYTFVSKDYKGIDPEVASGSQPLPRVHSCNLSITF